MRRPVIPRRFHPDPLSLTAFFISTLFFVSTLLLVTLSLQLIAEEPVSAADWLTLETPHFSITFQAGAEEVAREAGWVAEQAHEKLSQRFGHEPKRKTEIVLVDYSDAANGYAAPVPYNKEHLWLVYGGPNSTLQSKFDSWLQEVIVHEYTHTMQMDLSEGWTGSLRSVFGRVGREALLFIPQILMPTLTSPNSDLPTMLKEGLAVHEETDNFQFAGRGRSAYYNMVMRTDVLENNILTRDQASGKYPLQRFFADSPVYLYGYFFNAYIAKKYGEDRLMAISREYSQAFPVTINDVFLRVIGKSLPTVWDDFIASQKDSYAKQKADLDARGLTRAQRLTTTGEYAFHPVFSPDGKNIAYLQGGSRRVPALRIMGLDGKQNRTAVTTNEVLSGEGFSFSPDGSKVVYSKLDKIDAIHEFNDLYVTNLRTGRETRLTRGLRANGPSWSPDGKTIVFATVNLLQSRIMTMNADGTNAKVLVEGKDQTQYTTPVWSPDGSEIAFAALRYGGFADIYIMSADGTGVRALTQDRDQDFSPSWTPDGKYLLFDSDRTGVFNIFAMRLADGKLFQLTNTLGGAYTPHVSPDGKTLAYVDFGRDGFDVFTLPLDQARWEEFVYSKQPLPAFPNIAELTKGYSIHPYSAWSTLSPSWWFPILTYQQGAGILLGAKTSQEDLLENDAYNVYGGLALNAGQVFYGATYTKTFDTPMRPSLTLNLRPGRLSLQGQTPLSVSNAASSSLAARFETNGAAVAIGGTWSRQTNGGRDTTRTFSGMGLSGQLQLAGGGFALQAGAEGSTGWAFSPTSTLRVGGQLNLAPDDYGYYVITPNASIQYQTAIAHIEKGIGTLPIYFDKVSLLTFAQVAMPGFQAVAAALGGEVQLNTYLWYGFRTVQSVGITVSGGDIRFGYSLGI